MFCVVIAAGTLAVTALTLWKPDSLSIICCCVMWAATYGIIKDELRGIK